MDPIESLNPAKDSTLAMIHSALLRGWEVCVMELKDIHLISGKPFGHVRSVSVTEGRLLHCGTTLRMSLTELNLILMRKDPPVDLDFITSTYILEQAELAGVLVLNRPASLRDANEKVFATRFPQCCPESVITASIEEIKAFLAEYRHIVVKPLDQMGGRSVYVIMEGDRNVNVTLEDMTKRGSRFVQAQRYLPELQDSGDRRILLIDGNPIPYALIRHPQPGEARANLAAGGIPSGGTLTDRERWICAQISPELKRLGLMFVGIDVIGGWLTEINVTSPTGIRELNKFFHLDIANELLSALEKKWLEAKG